MYYMTNYTTKTGPTDRNTINNAFTYVNREGKSNTIVAPDFKLDPDMCAKYARLSAEELFDKKYTRSDAWNLKYVNTPLTPTPSLDNAEPGDIIVFYSPNSNYNTSGGNNLDRWGNIREGTHAGLLVDFDYNKQPIILHQFHSELEIGKLENIVETRNIKPVRIIKTKN